MENIIPDIDNLQYSSEDEKEEGEDCIPKDLSSLIQWLQDRKLIYSKLKCSRCNNWMHYSKENDYPDGLSEMCFERERFS